MQIFTLRKKEAEYMILKSRFEFVFVFVFFILDQSLCLESAIERVRKRENEREMTDRRTARQTEGKAERKTDGETVNQHNCTYPKLTMCFG